MDNLKSKIRAHLNKAGEANAKQIARATQHSEAEVINALNAMRTYAEIECEQGVRGKGLIYWLTNTGTPSQNTEKPAVDHEQKNPVPVPAYDPVTVGFGGGSITGDLRKQLSELTEKLAETEKQRDDHFATADDLRNQLALAENALGEWLRLANLYGC